MISFDSESKIKNNSDSKHKRDFSNLSDWDELYDDHMFHRSCFKPSNRYSFFNINSINII